MATLTVTAFEELLKRLDADDSSIAGEKYEELRLKLVKFFHWKTECPDYSKADLLADETLDRVAAKLAQGEEIEKLDAYSYQVARFVWLEYSRKNKEDNFGEDDPVIPVAPEIFDDSDDSDVRLGCLRKCLGEIAANDTDRTLILGWYDTAEGDKNKKQRKTLAEKLELTYINAKTKACRLRERLEYCISDCVKALNNV